MADFEAQNLNLALNNYFDESAAGEVHLKAEL